MESGEPVLTTAILKACSDGSGVIRGESEHPVSVPPPRGGPPRGRVLPSTLPRRQGRPPLRIQRERERERERERASHTTSGNCSHLRRSMPPVENTTA